MIVKLGDHDLRDCIFKSVEMVQPIKESFQMKSLIHSIQIEHLKVFNVPLTCATTMSHFTKILFPTLTITMKI